MTPFPSTSLHLMYAYHPHFSSISFFCLAGYGILCTVVLKYTWVEQASPPARADPIPFSEMTK
ncbi:MAG: hypothetical protein C4527_08440 [Candidatus Omnitrophota bacterium]|jgi:hypothetical protein|nr:MAG: hypothetical protein C4527_08440 [Candidatus Omnitrophota bacterium]